MVDRLSTQDRVMLWPDARWPQEVGAVGILDGRGLHAPDGSLWLDDVTSIVAARLARVPRLRQVLRVPRPPFGPPLWVDDPAFDLGHHLRVAAVAAPGGHSELAGAVARILSDRLDRTRPLWQIWFLSGLPEGRVGIYLRLHHSIADGIAALATFGVFLDPEPTRSGASPVPWHPTPAPSGPRLLADNLRRRTTGLVRGVAGLRHPWTATRSARTGWGTMRRLLAAPPSPGTALDQPVGASRRITLLPVDLATVRGLAHTHGATVNDIVLTLVAGGVRGWLGRHGGVAADHAMPAYVPKTLRTGPLARAEGNMIGQLVVPLPIGLVDPAARLARITAETTRLKAAGAPSVGTLLGSPLGRRLIVKVLQRHPVSITTADLVGPTQPRYLGPARLMEVYPVLPLVNRVTVGVGALSYTHTLGMTFVLDHEAIPDPELLVAGATADLAALVAAAQGAPSAAVSKGAA